MSFRNQYRYKIDKETGLVSELLYRKPVDVLQGAAMANDAAVAAGL